MLSRNFREVLALSRQNWKCMSTASAPKPIQNPDIKYSGVSLALLSILNFHTLSARFGNVKEFNDTVVSAYIVALGPEKKRRYKRSDGLSGDRNFRLKCSKETI